MRVVGWLAWRELWGRKRRFLASAALVAGAVALISATELVSRAREAAVATQMHGLAPTLQLTARAVSSVDLARFELGSDLVPEGTLRELEHELEDQVYALEGRLLRRSSFNGIELPIIGVPRRPSVGSLVDATDLGPFDALIGRDVARRLQKTPGDSLDALGAEWRISDILPPLGAVGDVALFVPLTTLQRATSAPSGVNVIRVYARPGTNGKDLGSLVTARHPELRVHGNADRGAIAEKQTHSTLSRHRGVVYGLTALAVALALLIASHINALERREELAMLVAMGGTGVAVLGALVARAATVGAIGATTGYVVGIGVALLQDAELVMGMPWPWLQPPTLIAGAVAVSMVAAFPIALSAAFRDHVRALQT